MPDEQLTDDEVLAELSAGLDDLDDGLIATVMSEQMQLRLCRVAGMVQSIAAEITRTRVQEYARLIVIDLATQVRELRDIVK